MSRAGRALATSFCLMLGACELAPPYAPPAVSAPASFREAGWVAAAPEDTTPSNSWWRAFNDPELNQLEERMARASQDLRAALARYDEARALARQARADLFPQVSGEADQEAGRLSRDVTNPLPHANYRQTAVHLDLGYELDVWGRLRDQAHAASAQLRASADDLAAVTLSLQAEVATDYFALRGYDAKVAIAEQAVEAYAQALTLTRQRFATGYTAEPDVSAAEAALESARTRRADLQLQRRKLEHALATLAGETPSELSIAPSPLAGRPPRFAAGAPAWLLQRRPDVAAAERRVQAANYTIGAARAAFFPSFDLSAAIGGQSAIPTTVLSAPAEVWALGGRGLLQLLDGGRRRAQLAGARAAFQEAAAAYRGTVLRAYGEVEDDLAALHSLDEETLSQSRAIAAASRATGQARLRYEGGYAAYYEVVTAQQVELAARLDGAELDARRFGATVALVKALGGGWQGDESRSRPGAAGATGYE